MRIGWRGYTSRACPIEISINRCFMKLLVVTATRGNSRWFGETALSVNKFKKLGIEVIWVVVGPLNLIDVLGAVASDAQFISEDGSGLYNAINQGVFGSVGSDWGWFTYINDDDGFCDGIYDLCLAAKQGVADVIYGDVDYVNEVGGPLGRVSICSKPEHLLTLFGRDIAPFTQQGVLIKRGVVESLRGYSKRFKLAADTDFFVRALIAGFKFKYIPVCTAFYRIRSGQLSNNTELMLKERVEVAALARNAVGGGLRSWLVLIRFRLANIFRTLNRRRLTGWVSTDRMFSGR